MVKQVEAWKDDEKRLYIAKQLEKSSIKNMRSLLKYYQKKDIQLDSEIELLEQSVKDFEKACSIDELLIIEAKTKQIYYDCFDRISRDENFRFIKRSKNPPENEINAMISYGNALLYAAYLSVLDRSSLNPQISYIHSLSKRSDPLQYDLADSMKPVIVDRLIFRLIRRKQIRKEHFSIYNDGRCYLNKEGAKIFVTCFDTMLAETILIRGKYYSYKSLISKEVHALSEYIKENTSEYSPYVMRW